MNSIYEIFFKEGSVLKIYGDCNIGDGIFKFF